MMVRALWQPSPCGEGAADSGLCSQHQQRRSRRECSVGGAGRRQGPQRRPCRRASLGHPVLYDPRPIGLAPQITPSAHPQPAGASQRKASTPNRAACEPRLGAPGSPYMPHEASLGSFSRLARGHPFFVIPLKRLGTSVTGSLTALPTAMHACEPATSCSWATPASAGPSGVPQL